MAKNLFESGDIRNVALVGHGSCGKTALGEAILFKTGTTTRLGSTVAGTGTFDFEPEEIKRGGSNSSAFAWVVFKNKKINFIDTPGDGNFVYDSFTAMQGADTAVILVSAPDGVEVQTERVNAEAGKLGLARIFVINKMDKERANPEGCIHEIAENLGVRPVAIQVPIGKAESFKGFVSLLTNKAYTFATDGSGKMTETDIPAEVQGACDEAWEKLTEAVAETDDALMEKYLDTLELSRDEVLNGLTAALKKAEITPVLFSSATQLIGIEHLLELITTSAPSPLDRQGVDVLKEEEIVRKTFSDKDPFAALVIRSFIDEFSGKLTIFRVFSGNTPADGSTVNRRTGQDERLGSLYCLRGNNRDTIEKGVFGDILAVAKLKDTKTLDTLTAANNETTFATVKYPEPMMQLNLSVKNKGDEDKLKNAVDKLIDEDPTLSIGYDDLAHKLMLRGMGQQHLDMAVDKMARKFKLDVETTLPLVPYRETLKKAVQNVEGKHKKQTGGAGQFGVCYINAEPLPRSTGFEFVDKIVGGAIPRQFIPAVEKGIHQRMLQGPMAGYPVTDLRVELVDGKYHPVDSKEVAFVSAGSKAIRTCLETGGSKLLEPVYRLDITIPSESMGDIMGDITSRRGRVLGMDPDGKKTTIHAIIPLSEIQRYAPDLRSMTGGQGIFTMAFEGYEDLPSMLEAKIIKESPFLSATGEDED